MNEVFRVYTHDDVVGVELAGALKNVAALCCGISDGCGMGDNTRALLITRALSEISRLAECMGGRKETLAGLAGMGDLIVTCTSMHSRNHRAGILIGQGKSAQEAMDEVGAVVEGYYAADSIEHLARELRIDMPICSAIYRARARAALRRRDADLDGSVRGPLRGQERRAAHRRSDEPHAEEGKRLQLVMTQKRGAKPLAFEKVSLRSVPSCPSKRTTRHSLRAKNFSDAHVVRKMI